MPDSEYIHLYQTTDWMFSYAFGEQVDLHLFDNYWSEPPPIKSFKKKMLERPKYTKHIPNPEPDPTHDLGISADYSTDTTTKIDTSQKPLGYTFLALMYPIWSWLNGPLLCLLLKF
jgi:hypothetical protein